VSGAQYARSRVDNDDAGEDLSARLLHLDPNPVPMNLADPAPRHRAGAAAAAIRRLLAVLAVLVVLVGAPAALAEDPAAAGAPPAALAAPLGVETPPLAVEYRSVLEVARRGNLNAAVVDLNTFWVAGVDRQGRAFAARIPSPQAGSDFGQTTAQAEATARRPARDPSAFDLAEWLRERNVVVVAPNAGEATTRRSAWSYVMLPLAILLIFVTFVVLAQVMQRRQGGRGRGGAGGHGRIRRTAKVEPPTTRFSDVAGCDEAVEELQEVVGFLREPERFAKVGARMPRGVILWGPPGTGKTLLARAVAGETGSAFYAMSGSDFVDTFVGVGAARVRDLFAEARKQEKGAIIFFDEIDAIGRQRGSGMSGSDSEREATLNQLLVELDGFGARDRIVVVAATNRVDMLDQALTRPGRFDRRVQVGLPAEAGRRAILGLYAEGKPLADASDLDRIAAVTAGFAGADLSNLLNEAAIMAARAGREEITGADLDEGMLRAIAGPEKRDRRLAPGELETIAWHEAGHCLAAELCPTHTKTQRVTILPRGDAGGLALYGTEDRALTSPQRLHERMVVAMAGRAAEQVGFGVISSGAANDLEQANGMARGAVERLGFSQRVGQIAVAQGPHAMPMSDGTRRAIDAEVADLVDTAYRDAVALLQEHRDVLETLALALLEREQLSREEIEEIVGGLPVTDILNRPRLPEPLPEPEPVALPVVDVAPVPVPAPRRPGRVPALARRGALARVPLAPVLRPLRRGAAAAAAGMAARGRVRAFRRGARGPGTGTTG